MLSLVDKIGLCHSKGWWRRRRDCLCWMVVSMSRGRRASMGMVDTLWIHIRGRADSRSTVWVHSLSRGRADSLYMGRVHSMFVHSFSSLARVWVHRGDKHRLSSGRVSRG